ncbi:Lipopolysaccharide biosynthesis regulator YciM, contains six TPR domains and a predicted metal-binding C-terminal domain [Roseivivax lentus]|uniref:Lipopolysaccharide biosynthesis regulator YciM, contains six TPR domains and a predicted metal-binding C-terminal domain n=1 Tax=Roseivivax lentus TaxID=633194 RepID=A0A1N7PXG0_9RHOB|nr:tetratricopeptide repeat protein [Roseivivax lentus]SIT15270.1 Lipopolysaccharide biosynthesis regulator YciM, contains six TPR domains and a predicted metal-binding C-terminal domain [Roseivivax lentus]
MPNTEEAQQWRPNVSQVAQDDSERMNFVRGLMRDGRTAEAQAELTDMLARDPQNTRIMLTLAISHLRSNELEQAAAVLEQLMRVDPKNRMGPLLAASVGLRGGNAEYAETHYQKALQADPTSIPALTGLASLHEQQNHLDQAVEVLSHAISLNPESAAIRRQMARLLAKRDDPGGAAVHLRHALDTHPKDVRTATALARLHFQNDETGAAIKVVEETLVHSPDSRPLLQLLGTLKIATRDYAAAEMALGKVLEAAEPQRGLSNVRIAMARALIPQKKLTEARAMLAQVNRRNLLPVVQRLYGDAFAAESRFEDAENSYRSSMIHMPEGEEAIARVEQAKAVLKSPDGKAVLQIYEAEFANLRESFHAKAQKRREEGVSAEQLKDMAERRQQRRMRRRQMMMEQLRNRGAQGFGRGGFGRQSN